MPFENFSNPGADNFFIFYSILENYKKIQTNDIVVVGWSHPSRKTFIYDNINQKQKSALDNSLLYKTKKYKFIRNNGQHTSKIPASFWSLVKPRNSKVDFYDRWFRDYYNIHEQNINFQSYLISTEQMLQNINYSHFFFSKESTTGVKCKNKLGFMLDFAVQKKVSISKNDYHLNEKGHRLWAEKLYKGMRK